MNTNKLTTFLFIVIGVLLIVNGLLSIFASDISVGLFSKYNNLQVQTGFLPLFFGLFSLIVGLLRVRSKSQKNN